MMLTRKNSSIGRREFLKKSMASMGALAVTPMLDPYHQLFTAPNPVVCIVKIQNDQVDYAVEKAIDLLGGINEVARHKQKIMLKPNLVFDDPNCTTKPVVIRTLARLMKAAGKEVFIGEGSAAASGLNADENGIYFTSWVILIWQKSLAYL
jgi:hypothetical protein